MSLQKEACPHCHKAFEVEIRISRETYHCLECGGTLVVIQNVQPSNRDGRALIGSSKIESYLLEKAELELTDYLEAQKEGLPVNRQALESCQERIRKLRTRLGR